MQLRASPAVASPHRDAPGQLEPAPAADAARGAGAAALVGGEAPDVAQQLGRRGAVVERDQAAVAELDAGLAQRLERERHVELVRAEEAAERPADLQRDAAARPSRRPPPSSSHDRAHARAELDLVGARALEALVQADDLRAVAVAEARARRRRRRRARRSTGSTASVSTLLTTVGRP